MVFRGLGPLADLGPPQQRGGAGRGESVLSTYLFIFLPSGTYQRAVDLRRGSEYTLSRRVRVCVLIFFITGSSRRRVCPVL